MGSCMLFSLLHPLLQRIQVEEVGVILVAPNWAPMIWFSAFAPLLWDQLWELPGRKDLLTRAQGSPLHPFPHGLKFWAWPLRGPGFLIIGLPHSVVNALQGARAPSTRAAYSYRWEKFVAWCRS